MLIAIFLVLLVITYFLWCCILKLGDIERRIFYGNQRQT